MKKAARTSETSVCSSGITNRYIPEGSNIHTRHGENLKYYTTTTFIRTERTRIAMNGTGPLCAINHRVLCELDMQTAGKRDSCLIVDNMNN
jgi:hypothetical protein